MKFLNKIDKASLPAHIGVIMDGNGRWATQRKIPRFEGHRNAVNSVRACVEAATELELKVLTLFAFSTENWQRPKDEVSALMNLFFEFLEKELDTMLKNNINFKLIGDREGLPSFLQDRLGHALDSTEDNEGLLLNLALNYGGRDEIVRAARAIAMEVKEGKLQPEKIDESLISMNTYTSGIPDPDLIIRTSGEKRLSNFLIWQSAYAEYFFTEVLWPDFTKDNLHEAIFEYQQRKRRMGGTSILKADSRLINDTPLSIKYKKNTKISKTSI